MKVLNHPFAFRPLRDDVIVTCARFLDDGEFRLRGNLDPASVSTATRGKLSIAIRTEQSEVARSIVSTISVRVVENKGQLPATPDKRACVEFTTFEIASDRQAVLLTPTRIAASDLCARCWLQGIAKDLKGYRALLSHDSSL